MLRKIGCLFGLVLALPVTVLVMAGLAAPLSPSGWLYLAALVLVVGGLISGPFREDRLRGVTRAGVALVGIVALVRVGIAGEGRTVSMVVLPDGGSSSHIVDRLVDEQDLTVPGARLLTMLGAFPQGDGAAWPGIMADRYAAMRTAEGWVPSAVASTYLGMQSSRAFATVIVEPRTSERAEVGVVFLHGYAGSFTVLCWQMALAAQAIDAVTACPATEWQGQWWQGDEGLETVRATMEHLRRRGVERIYLAGLSNGAAGVSALAPRLRGLSGVVLLSGVRGGIAPPRVPVLLVHGRSDRMMTPGPVRAYATAAGRRATLVELDGGHF
ncbi:MAG: alpha/beta hydrolase, partial [Deltaproteobacteria bacterium]|nr:alpha/beta hydrolase [Deltaproteobacteria bacterium]